MKRKHKRLTFVVIGVGLIGLAAGLVLAALNDTVSFFRTPSELAAQPDLGDRRIRLGGLVEEGSVERVDGSAVIRFRVTDLQHAVSVTYKGILPDLFREGQGVVALGRMQGTSFRAEEVLAKHDETYMPPEVADALKKSGKWQHMQEALTEQGRDGGGAPRAVAEDGAR